MSAHLILKMFLSWLTGKKVARNTVTGSKMYKDPVYIYFFYQDCLLTNNDLSLAWHFESLKHRNWGDVFLVSFGKHLTRLRSQEP